MWHIQMYRFRTRLAVPWLKRIIMDWFRLILALVIMLVVIAFGSFIIGLVWYLLWLVAWWLFPVLVGLLFWWMIYKVLLEKKK